MVGGIVAGASTVLIVGILATLVYRLKTHNRKPTVTEISGRTMWGDSPDAPERETFLEDNVGVTLEESEEHLGAPHN